LIPIQYNFIKPILNKGSCIFMHLTNNHKPTAGCIALKNKDFLIILKLITKKTKIKII
jgi:L,D-peptidoglycan transpeptidase YkuD (ErfK/YbiS/YcfS/YnhG family)